MEEMAIAGRLLGGSHPSRWPLACCRLCSLHYSRALYITFELPVILEELKKSLLQGSFQRIAE